MPTVPGFSPAEMTLAVLPPMSEDTEETGSLFGGPRYWAPSIMASLAASGPTRPRPVAYSRIVSPGIAGLSEVIGAYCLFAQQSTLFVAVNRRFAPLLTDTTMGMPLPTGPGSFERRRMRVKAEAAEATTRSS